MRVVIVGAGIGGLALAYWLDRAGFEPVVIEAASKFEPLGHYLALRGTGVSVAREMGIEAACRRRQATFARTRFFRADGRLLRTLANDVSDRTLGGYILFRRSDLHEALNEAVAQRIPVHFGVRPEAIRQDAQRVTVRLSDGEEVSADFLVGADGIHSATRRLVFGTGFARRLGGRYIGLTLRFDHGMDTSADDAYFGVGQMAALMPTDADRISGIMYHGDRSGPPADRQALKPFLQRTFAGFAAPVRELIERIQPDSYLFSDDIAQISMPSIVSGRVTLVGDAAHCPTFMSGMGSALALQDARALARHLARQPSPDGLLAYQAAMQPVAEAYARSARRLAPFLLRGSQPRSWVRNTLVHLLPNRLIERGMQDFYNVERVANR